MSEPWLKAPLEPRKHAWSGEGLSDQYERAGLDVTVDRVAMDEADDDRAIVVIEDLQRWVVYGVAAAEDEHGRARLLSLTISPIEHAESPFGRYLDGRPERSREWLARTAIECARQLPAVNVSIDSDELLQYVAATVRRCEAEGTNPADILRTKLTPISDRTLSRVLRRAADAGLIDKRKRGRPSTSSRKDSPNA